MLGLYLVGELTHMRSMCVGVAETGVGASTTRTIHNATFLLSRFCMPKSYLRGVPPCLGDAKAPFFILFVLFVHAKKHYKASFFLKIKISFPIPQGIHR